MTVNLINLSVTGIPINELKVLKIDDSTFGLPLNIDSNCPPFSSDNSIDHPDQYIKLQNWGYYEREKVYRNKGNTNVESNKNDKFVKVRRKELAENAINSPIRIEPKLTKDILEANLRSKNFQKYPMKKDEMRYPKPMAHWKDDKNTNLVLEDSYYSTNVNRGRSEYSHNSEIIIGEIIYK
jgi:hypothetical protein